MKKSKIIIGAIALLGVSVAATTTGTLAWFSATNSTSVSVGNINAIKTVGDLKAVLSAVDNTTVTGSTVSVTNKLTHMSFNTYTPGVDVGKKYYIIPEDSSVEDPVAASYKEITTANYSTKVSFYASFTIAFTTSDDSNTTYSVLLDDKSSSLTTDTTNEKVATGARFGFVVDGKNRFVYAPKTAQNTGAATYVKGLTKDDVGDDGSIVKTNNTTKLTDETAAATITASPLYLGDLKGTGTLTTTATIWFEGTDSGVVSANVGETFTALSSSLGFYAIKKGA